MTGPGHGSSEDRLAALESLWSEVIDSIHAGRTAGLVCPECQHPDGLAVEEAQGRLTVSCSSCKRVIEVGIAAA